MSKVTSIASLFVLTVGIALIACNAARGAYVATVLADNPLAYYHMDDTSGTTMTDSILPPTNNGTYGSGVTLNAIGPRPPAFSGFSATNNAGQFDGTATSKAQVAAISGFSATTYSMEVWFNYNNNTLKYLMSRGSGASLQYDSVGLNGANLLFFNGVASTFSGFNVSTNAWHDLVLTRSPTAVNVYLDGVNRINVTSGAGFTNTLGGSTRVVVGDRAGDVGGINPTGFFDEFSLYNTELTQTQVTEHYLAALPEPTSIASLGAGLIGYLAASRRRSRSR